MISSSHFSFRLSAILVSLLTIKFSSGLVLECNFAIHEHGWGKFYTCHALDLVVTKEDRTITEIKGQHMDGKSNDDIEEFYVHHGDCTMLPLNLGAFFKNLDIFYVKASQVKKLTSEDLKGLNKLKVFDVSHNLIERLEKGIFDGHSSIEKISFVDNELNFIDKDAFDSLVNLKGVHFQRNRCIDFHRYHKDILSKLKDAIEKCDGSMPAQTLFEFDFDEYRDYEVMEYADFHKEDKLHHESLTRHPFKNKYSQLTLILIISLIAVVICVVSVLTFIHLHKNNKLSPILQWKSRNGDCEILIHE